MSIPPSANSTIARGIRHRGSPDGTFVPSRAQLNASIAGARGLTLGSQAISAAAPAVAPPERLFSGNLRRLWLSEIASTAGDAVLGAGLLIWFTQLRLSFTDVTFLVLALATPAALVAIFAGSLGSVRRAPRLLGLVGVLRVLLAIVYIGLYFDTIIPLVYLLAFGLALASSLRLALRHGAIAHGVPVRARGLLASGDQVAASVLAVAGPALATLLYILNGERIFTISLGAAAFYILALVGESRASPLPDRILYQKPAERDQVHSAWEKDEDTSKDAAVIAAEQDAAVWELAPPPNPGAAIADIDHGLQIAGAASHPQYAFIAVATLALIGGGLAVLEPFYVWTVLLAPPYVLGLLFTATGVGGAIASAVVVEVRGGGRIFLLLGLLGSGVGLLLLARTTDLPHALAYVGVLGAANVFALRGGQVTVMRHFVPVGQRAVAQSLTVTRAWMTLIGIIAVWLFGKSHRIPLPTLGLINLLTIGGGILVGTALVAAVILILPNRLAPVADDDLDPLPDEEEDEDESLGEDAHRYQARQESDRDDASRYLAAYDDSRRYAAYDESGRRAATRDDDEDEAPRRRSR